MKRIPGGSISLKQVSILGLLEVLNVEVVREVGLGKSFNPWFVGGGVKRMLG